MNRIQSIFLVLLLCISCTDKTETQRITETIEIAAEDITYLGNGTTAYIETVLPSEIYSEQTAVSLEVMESNISYFQGTSPIFYTLGSIEKIDGTTDRYKIGIRDLGKGEKYVDKVRFVMKWTTGKGTKKITSETFSIVYASNDVLGLSFLKEDNETALLKDFELDLSSSHIVITSPFITKSTLALDFKTEAAKVVIDDIEQISGQTVNDFSKPVTYSFISAAGEVRRYTIQVRHSGLPVVFINTPGGTAIPPKTEDWLDDTSLTIYDTDCRSCYSGKTEIRGRGNSTWKYPKKPYALKLSSKAEILGMPKHKRWVLLANWLDRTLLRNHVSFRIAMQTGLDWTPRGEFVEVVLNDRHIGCYYLCEHIKIDENRVNIDELDEDETDGGYMMEIDTYYDETFKFKSAVKSFPYMFKDPDEVNDAQFTFMMDYINNLEGALYDDERFAAREYADYLDIDSFIDFWIAYELTGNTETHHPKSTYVHKDKGGKLKAGPVWDFDWKTFRLDNEEWVTMNHLYYEALFKDPVFVARVKERWEMHEAKLREIPAFIESEAERIHISESMNHQMWPVTQNTNEDISLAFPEAVARMKKSYEAKLEFMDKEIARL